MKKKILISFSFLMFYCNSFFAFPTSLYWTVCTTDILPTGYTNLEVANYFTLLNGKGKGQAFPPDIGLTLGLFSRGDWKAEVGFDYFGGLSYPWFFNGKVGIEENKLCSRAPSFAIGIFYMGTKSRFTNFNVIDVVIGKTLPSFLSGGRVFLGAYIGNHALGRDQGGFMLGYLKKFCKTKDCHDIEYWKWWLVADYASGNNFIGGGGIGLCYFFNPYTCIVTGPTWFNDLRISGKWKWTIQVDILFQVFKCR